MLLKKENVSHIRYVQYKSALHNLKSSIPIDWHAQYPRYEQNRLIHKQKMEHEYIKREYNNKIQRQLNRRYNQNLSTFRVLMQDYGSQPYQPNHHDKQILQHQIQNFNISKDLSSPMNKNNPQNNIKLHPENINDMQQQHAYRIQSGQRHPKQNQQYAQQYQQKYQNHANSDHNYNQQQYMYQNNHNSPNLYQNRYNSQDFIRNKKYPDLYHGNGVEFYNYPFKNLLPDRLEQFLRQKTKIDNKKTLNFSRVNQKNQKRQKSL